MFLTKKITFQIDKITYQLKSISENDVDKKYIQGLKNNSRNLSYIPRNVNIESQKQYVNEKINSENSALCGLFKDKVLIGTCGVQIDNGIIISLKDKIQKNKLYASLGILIIDDKFKGKGLGKALVWSTTSLINDLISINNFYARMYINNLPSLKSFEASGFKIYKKVIESNEQYLDDYYVVILNFKNIKKPNLINNYSFEEIK